MILRVDITLSLCVSRTLVSSVSPHVAISVINYVFDNEVAQIFVECLLIGQLLGLRNLDNVSGLGGCLIAIVIDSINCGSKFFICLLIVLI